MRPSHGHSIEGLWDKMGYETYFGLYSGCVAKGLDKGGITFVRNSLRSSMQLLLGQDHGALLGVEVDGCLVVMSSAFPELSGNCQQEQAALLEELLATLNWQNGVIIGGDFNEERSNSWISIAADLRGLDIVMPAIYSTRWDGSRVIDDFLVDDALEGRSWPHHAKTDDHKIMVLEIKQRWWWWW